MINLRALDRIESDDINAIINEKNEGPQKKRLLEIKTNLLERYSKFIEIELGNRINSIACTDQDKDSLQSLYSSKTATSKLITTQILSSLNPNHSDTCLYCGIWNVDELDHYLPIEHFPEYSILHKNLIPICGKCNKIKGSNIPGIEKDYLHSIFNILPLDDIYTCCISYSEKIPDVNIEIIEKYKETIIGKHFNALKLKTRLKKKAVQYFLQIKAIKEKFGVDFANEELDRDLKKFSAFFGVGFWKISLLKEMLASNFVNEVD